MLAILQSGTFREESGGGGGGNYPGPPVDGPLADFAFLLAALVFWGFSLFLVHYASAFQKWVTPDHKNAPDTDKGVFEAWVISAAVFLVWGFYVLLNSGLREPDGLVLVFLGDPRRLVPAPLIASFFPAATAGVKFLVSFVGRAPESDPKGPSAAGTIVGAAVSVLHLAATIATLIMFRDYLFASR